MRDLSWGAHAGLVEGGQSGRVSVMGKIGIVLLAVVAVGGYLISSAVGDAGPRPDPGPPVVLTDQSPTQPGPSTGDSGKADQQGDRGDRPGKGDDKPGKPRDTQQPPRDDDGPDDVYADVDDMDDDDGDDDDGDDDDGDDDRGGSDDGGDD